MTLKKKVAAVATALTIGGIAFVAAPTPVAAASSCAGAGYLCFKDFGTGIFGNVSGNNPWWGSFAGGWNDRADWFRNDGVSCNVKIYKDVNYNDGAWWFPEDKLLYRGSTVEWSNVVSSNHWWFPSGASCA